MASKTVDFLINVKGNAGRELKALGSEMAGVTKNAHRMNEEMQDTAGRLASLGGVISGIPIPGFEGLGRAVTAAGDSFEAMANPVGAAIVLLGGSVAVVGSVTAGVVGLTLAANDWLDTLYDVGAAGGLITPEQEAMIRSASAAVDGLGIGAKRVGVAIAAEFAPTVEEAAVGLLALVQATESLDMSWAKTFVLRGGPLAVASRGISELSGGIIPSFESQLESLNATLLKMTGFDKIQQQVRETIKEFKAGSSDDFMPFVGPEMPRSGGRGGGGESRVTSVRGVGPMADVVPAIDALPTAISAMDLTVSPTRSSLGPMIEAMDKQREQISAAVLGSTTSPESLVRSIPVVGNIIADAVSAVLNLPSLVKQITKGAIELPKMLSKAITVTLNTAIPNLIENLDVTLNNLLVKMPPAIVKGVIRAVPKIIVALAKAIGQAVANALRIFRGKEGKFLGTSFKKGEFSIFGIGNKKDKEGARGSFATGGFVPETGIYRLHAGERVIPTSGASTGAADRAARGFSSGGSLMIGQANITIQTNDVRDMMRQLRRELGSYGSGASLTPR